DTFSITTKKESLDIFLPDGRNIKVEILTSDTAERVLEVVSHNIGLCQELLDCFGLFLIQFCKEGRLSGKKDRRRCRQPELVGWYGQTLSQEMMDCS
ncbi:hypothetical protein Celaphus_00016403, partial [Cervus elaphus hippelaphus]